MQKMRKLAFGAQHPVYVVCILNLEERNTNLVNKHSTVFCIQLFIHIR